MGLENARSDLRWQDEYVAFSDGRSCAPVLDLPRSFDAHQYARDAHGADGKRRLSAQAPQSEMFTVEQSFAFHWGRRLHQGRHPTDRAFRKINARKRLIDLECTRLSSLRVNIAPVIQAKRHVAILLNFEHDKVSAKRMHRPSRQENSFAGLRD